MGKVLILVGIFVVGCLWGEEIIQFLASAADELSNIASGK